MPYDVLLVAGIVHPGNNVHLDCSCLNHCSKDTLSPRKFKLSGMLENSSSFKMGGSVSMETSLTFDPRILYEYSC